ncbi:MAG: PQQ-binding-like beta-propeller repeat protein [Verrucomicrobiales bacterium]|nr:PQQ-binding-like beta-propeller repeat protein [Verrucomicrobiales bacterium]
MGITILLLTLLQVPADLDRNFRAWLNLAAVLLGAILMLLWLLFGSGLQWWKRLAWLGAIVAVVLVIKGTTRPENAGSGTGIPKLVWRWSPTKDEAFARARIQTPTPSPASTAARAPDLQYQFPQFLGPQRNGRVEGARLARDWNSSPPRELWRIPVGLGWSGFVVARGLAITQEQAAEDELVTARALRTGALVWAHTNHARFTEFLGGDGPRATPTLTSNRVYAFGATGFLNCLDLDTGRRIWTVDVLKTNHLNNDTWGKSSAPLVTGGKVIVSGGTDPEKGWLAYDARTGQLLWSGDSETASYASASEATLGGRRQILVVGKQGVAGLDPDSGRAGWRFAWGSDKNPKCSQPVVLEDDRVFLSAGYGAGCVLIQVKPTADGSLAATELWRGKSMKTQFNNVAALGGNLYGLDDGLLACVDASTGKRLWKDGRYGSGQSLLVDDLILVQSEPGFVALVEARPDTYRELGRIPALSSKTWNNPALAGPFLLVRNDQEAVCYEVPTMP